VPIVTASALTGKRVRKTLEVAREVQDQRTRRIATAEVNQVLGELLQHKQPPQGGRGDVKIYYGSQVATAPPQFVLWTNRPEDVKTSYVRYLSNGFRAAWGFGGAPIRIRLRRRGEEAGRSRGRRNR
jgi:GTP-binding protein